MKTKRRLAAAIGLAMAFSASLFGQSMIEYGHGVARAGAAGAASGAGLGGIFTTMKDTTDDADKKKRSSEPIKSSQQSQAAEQVIRADGEPANAPLKITTRSGVVVSGVSPSWMGAYSEPAEQTVRVRTVEWANPREEQAAAEQGRVVGQPAEPTAAPASSSGVGTEQTKAGQVVTSGHTASPGRVSSPGHVVGNASPHFTGSGDVSLGAGTAAASEPITDAEVAGVRLGSAIEEVIGLLGQPAFALTGIAGKSYTEKYVFKRGDGATIIVFTWNGAVTAISLS